MFSGRCSGQEHETLTRTAFESVHHAMRGSDEL